MPVCAWRCLLCLAVVHGSLACERGNRDSILLITIDTLRADHLPFYGYQKETAPFLSELADTSVVFTNAHSVSSWTAPALFSLLAGAHPAGYHIQLRGEVEEMTWFGCAPPNAAFLSERLADVGYRTRAVVCSPYVKPGYGLAHGFEGIDSLPCGVGYSDARIVTDRAIEVLSRADDNGRPLFMWVHYFDPHFPYHRRTATSEPPSYAAAVDRVVKTWPTPPPELEESLPELIPIAESYYDSEIRFVDQQIERLFSAHPQLDRFLVLVAGDHGEEFYEHGSFDHGSNLHAETVRIPLLVRRPFGAERRNESALVSILDIPPTLVSWASAPVPPEWHGRALPGLRATDRFPANRSLLSTLEYQVTGQPAVEMEALISDDWKLIVERPTGNVRLFDRRSDPTERNDLAGTNQEGLQSLATELSRAVAERTALPLRGEPVPACAAEELNALGYVD